MIYVVKGTRQEMWNVLAQKWNTDEEWFQDWSLTSEQIVVASFDYKERWNEV